MSEPSQKSTSEKTEDIPEQAASTKKDEQIHQTPNLAAKREVARKKKTFKIIVIGDSGVGKTCLTYRFCSGKFPSTPTDATIGVDFREKIITLDNNEQVYELNNFCNDFTFYKLFYLKLLYILFPYPYFIYIFILCF